MIDGKIILIKAASVNDTYRPIWEFTHEENEMYGDVYEHDDTYREFFKESFVDAYYDINTKKITTGIKVYIPPSEGKYNVGDKVLIEQGHHVLFEDEISEVIYISTKYESVLWGAKAKSEYGRWCDEKFDANKLYHIIPQECSYKLKNSGKEVQNYQIFKIVKNGEHK